NGYDAKLGNKISVTVIATGFEINPNRILSPEPVRENVVVPVYDRIEESESMIVDREDPPQIVPEYRPKPPVSQPISQPIPEPVPVSAPAPVEATAPTYTPEPERSILEFDTEPFTVRKDEKEVETARQERNTKKTPIPKIKDGNEPIGSWFNRQFGALFNEDEDDVEIKR
ncbi:MAG: hypothetical protein NTV75_10965, partial [Bacteroidia bacterium]|nr:hypothetical protein [Bacteroidia bacterium]